jgi:hypothetical protein
MIRLKVTLFDRETDKLEKIVLTLKKPSSNPLGLKRQIIEHLDFKGIPYTVWDAHSENNNIVISSDTKESL